MFFANILSTLAWQIYVKPIPTLPLDIQLTNTNTANKELSAHLFASYPLFGIPPVKKVIPAPKPQIIAQPKKVQAPLPKVKLQITGILTGNSRLAIIKVHNVEETFAVGEYVSHLIIHEIGDDYVVFDDQGYLHTVFVEDGQVAVGGVSNTINENYVAPEEPVNVVPQQPVGGVAENNNTNNTLGTIPGTEEAIRPALTPDNRKQLQEFKKTVAQNPLAMVGKVNATPVRKNGKILGYQITPGSAHQLFRSAGLQSGDVVLSVNGIKLEQINDFTSGLRLMRNLGKGDQLNLVILRRGQVKQIYLDYQ